MLVIKMRHHLNIVDFIYVVLFVENIKGFLELKNNIKIYPLVICFKIQRDQFLLSHKKETRNHMNEISICLLVGACGVLRELLAIEVKT